MKRSARLCLRVNVGVQALAAQGAREATDDVRQPFRAREGHFVGTYSQGGRKRFNRNQSLPTRGVSGV